jgi:hypothetical protein
MVRKYWLKKTIIGELKQYAILSYLTVTNSDALKAMEHGTKIKI